MTSAYHGGRRTRRRQRRQHGGAAEYPSSFDALLPKDMHGGAGISSLDTAFGDLPQFAGKYGQVGGRRHRHRRSRANRKIARRQHGGVAPVDAPGMLLTPDMEAAAHLSGGWYTENSINPNFIGPASPYAASQKGGRKSRRNNRKSSTRRRRNNRK